MTFVQPTPFDPEPLERNPVTQRQIRRQIWLEIYLPFIVGAAAVIFLAVTVWNSGRGTASAWSDASAILLLVPLLLVLVLPLLLTIAAIVGITMLIQRLPPPLYRVQIEVDRIAADARRLMRQSAQPLVGLHALRASASRAVRHLASTFHRERSS